MKTLISLSPSEALQARGILEQAIKAGWIESKDPKWPHYWHYPIFDLAFNPIAKRAKSFPNQDQAKYAWPDGKPDNPQSDYYILPGTKETIAQAGGVCYLANGEAAVLAMKAAGIHNVISTTHSEITTPKTLIETLQALGISKLINIADKDKAGIKAAAKWRDTLRDSGIEYQAKQWPDYLPEKSDANDLWIAVKFKQEAFQATLLTCEALLLPQPEIKPIKLPINPDETPQGLIELLIEALGAKKFAGDGWSENFKCPHHDEKEPSAGINKDSGVVSCFVCGNHAPRDTAEKLAIDWRRFYPQQKPAKQSKPVRITKPIENLETSEQVMSSEMVLPQMYATQAWPAGKYTGWIGQDDLPLSWIKALLHIAHSKSILPIMAIRFHKAIRQGLIDPTDFTIKDVIRVLMLPRLSIQSAINSLIGMSFLWILQTKYLENSVNTESIKNPPLTNKGGRPEIRYAINACTEDLQYNLAEMLEPCLLERLTEKDLAPAAPSMRNGLDLEYPAFKEWHERTKAARHEQNMRIIQEMVADVLESTAGYSIGGQQLESPSALRGHLLRNILAPYSEDRADRPKGLQISRAKLSLELGCSPSCLSKLYEDYGIGTKRIKGWYEVVNPNQTDIEKELREAPFSLSKEQGGVSIGMRLKVWAGKESKYLPICKAAEAKAQYEKYNGRIDKCYIWVEQPSLLWLMNAEELEAAKRAKVAVLLEKDGVEQINSEEKPVKVQKPRFVNNKDRTYKSHSQEWLHEKLALEVHVYTKAKLQGLNILSAQGETLTTCSRLADVVIWLNQNATSKQVRTVESFYMPEKTPLVIEEKAIEKVPVTEVVSKVIEYQGGSLLSDAFLRWQKRSLEIKAYSRQEMKA